MIYFEDWWSLGDNCVGSVHPGFLADDKKTNDICIETQEDLNKFYDKIAQNIYVTNDGGKHYSYQKNSDDVLLNKKIQIDFNKNFIFIITAAEIKEILFSKIFQCYMITYSEKKCDESSYVAVIVNKYESQDNVQGEIKFQIMNEKPDPIKSIRPRNDNDDY